MSSLPNISTSSPLKGVPESCDLPGVLQNTKTPQVWELPKKIRENYKITHFRFGPKNTKKLPKITILCNFSVIFSDFWAKPEMGDFVIFSYFSVIPKLEGFLYSVAPQGDRKTRGLQ